MAKSVTNSDALTSMGHCDDSLSEIDAMITRLLKMKKQIIDQKNTLK